MIINELVSKFSFNVGNSFKQMNRRMAGMVRMADKTTAKTESLFQRMGSKIGKSLKHHFSITGIDKAKSQLAGLQRQASKMKGPSMGVGGMLAGVGVGAGAAAAAKSVYETGTSRESLLVGLKNLPGMDAASALSKFKELEKFNLETPYTLDEIAKSYIRLSNIGLDSSKKAMMAYGGIAASIPGKKITDFVEAVADGVMGESERLKEFSIGMKKDGDRVTLSFRNQKYNIKNDAKEIERTIQKIAFDNFGNAMAEMAKTTEGKMSNLSDAVDNLKWQIWEGGMKKAVRGLIEGTSQLISQWSPLIKEFTVYTRLNMPAHVDKLKIAVIGLGTAFLWTKAHALGMMYLKVGGWALKTAANIRALGLAQWFVNGAFSAIPGVIGLITIALGGLIADFIYYFNTGDSLILRFIERWPKLHAWVKDAYEMNKIFWTAVGMGLEQGWEKFKKFFSIVSGLFQKFTTFLDNIGFFTLMEKIFILPKVLSKAADLAQGIIDWWATKTMEHETGASTTPQGTPMDRNSRTILRAAQNFAAGTPGQSAADKWAKSGATQDGMSVKKLFIDGVACAITAEKIVGNAGASQQVLNAMTPSVPNTYKNLLNQGLVEKVLFSELKGGEIFYSPGLTHTGVVGEGGKSLIHAANSKGSKIGMGQRVEETGNYLGSKGVYLRIKDQYMGSPQINIVQNFGGPANPTQVKQATQQGVSRSLATNQPVRVPGGVGDILGF